jgi:hypothetical protein
MAINYTYPLKASPQREDEFLIIDSVDDTTKRVTAGAILGLGQGNDVGVSSLTATTPLSNSGTNSDVVLILGTVPVGKGGTGLTSVGSVGTVLTSTGSAAVWSSTVTNFLPLAGGQMTGNITMSGSQTVDGRDVSADGTKLDTIESNADVTDAANVTAAGALMDSEITNLAQVKAFDTTDYATATQGALATNALPKSGGAMTGPITTNSTFDGVNVSVRNAVLTTTTTTANAALPKSGGAMTGAITTNSTFDGVDVAARNAVLTTTTTTASAALPKTGGTMTGSIAGVTLITNLLQVVSPTQAGTIFNPGNGSFASLNASAPISSVTVTVMPSGTTSKLFLTNTTAATSIPSWIDSGGAPIKWAGGSSPTITNSIGKVDVITFEFLAGAVYGSIIQNYS